MNEPYICRTFFQTDWRHLRHENTIEISSMSRASAELLLTQIDVTCVVKILWCTPGGVLEIVLWLTSGKEAASLSVAQSWPYGNYTVDEKEFEQTVHFVSVFLLPFLTSKQISAVVLAVFWGRYLRMITIQPIRQLQWTDINATFENLIIFFLENNKMQ